jgi:hypothetical protein
MYDTSQLKQETHKLFLVLDSLYAVITSRVFGAVLIDSVLLPFSVCSRSYSDSTLSSKQQLYADLGAAISRLMMHLQQKFKSQRNR